MKLLTPIKEKPEDYDAIEKEISIAFKKFIYIPLMKELGLGQVSLKNSIDDLSDAIQRGRIQFNRGKFTGKFTTKLAKELRAIGATWSRQYSAFILPSSQLPPEVRRAVDVSESRFQSTASKINKILSEMSPAEIAGKMKLESLFESSLWKVDKEFQKSVKGITIAPKLTEHQAKRISTEYTQNMQLYIKDWAEKEIVELRDRINERATKGYRYETVIKEIEKSYGVSQRKAKFLARQETSLMMTKFKQVRYEDAGVNEYIWGCVAGSPNHPVRPMHKALEGKIFRWDKPPKVNDKGEKKNPGQDYGCRCFARPIVKF